MKITLKEAKENLLIKRDKLDVEVETHSGIFEAVSEQCVESMSIRDYLKEERERIWADVFLTTKKSSAEGKAPSDKVAETTADASEEYREATINWLNAKKVADEWIVMKESFHQKSDMLKELSRLISSGYANNISLKGTKENLEYAKLKKHMREDY